MDCSYLENAEASWYPQVLRCCIPFSQSSLLSKKRKDYAFRRQFNEKPRIIPGCPGVFFQMHACQDVLKPIGTLQYELPYQSLSLKHKIEFAICHQKSGWENTARESHGKAQGKLMSSAQQTVRVFRPLPRPPGVTLLTHHAIRCVVSL